ncbi:hypothetical protein A4H97_14125 [Niastella yeongjuensis]|uniref:N-acetyltransferase domain-containing protein n=1 Tax=Niastella yeongjuensis TaxID=354355 RepID=A0A1V9E3P7_9BACT|nr:hypothetical protein [Niastella yeongjuensis]OQP40753.1 hypothetical protein A4H97_14125 [Niastella yeongjuensis]SEP02742.1 hypothetical protein SAMN05660816_04231 [Niastella yeongjuensis]
MDNEIISKFTVATEDGVKALQTLAMAISREKFGSLTTEQVLKQYLSSRFSLKALAADMNDLSNQWVVVYANNEPAGYVRITSIGKRPQMAERKRMIRLADFGILKKYDDPKISLSLLDKCLSVCGSYDGIWIHEYTEHPLLPFFESHGFYRLSEVPGEYELPLASVYLFREAN